MWILVRGWGGRYSGIIVPIKEVRSRWVGGILKRWTFQREIPTGKNLLTSSTTPILLSQKSYKFGKISKRVNVVPDLRLYCVTLHSVLCYWFKSWYFKFYVSMERSWSGPKKFLQSFETIREVNIWFFFRLPDVKSSLHLFGRTSRLLSLMKD